MMFSRRAFCQATTGALAVGFAGAPVPAQIPGQRPEKPDNLRVLNPRARVPCGLIIDDSTCLVNMAHFCMPQFAEVWPQRKEYQKPWQQWPREIPDDFVRDFGQWSHDQGVKGKYSIVPYPACVGWIDRDLPGWSYQALQQSLQLVRELIVPDWDIHPEMVSHTWVVDTKTGRPYSERTAAYMENWRWTDGKSVDQLADYLQYALQLLRNVGLDCEGVTTPGGFAGRVKPELAQATLQACRDVGRVELPHYFKYVETGAASTDPRVEYARNIHTDHASCVVSMIAGTGDWFGGWDGVTYGDIESSVDRFVRADLKAGRLVELIQREQAVYMLCHWPGFYCNGKQVGYRIYQEVVRRVNQGFGDQILWMKLSDLARYAAARALTTIRSQPQKVQFYAPFACPDFTMSVSGRRPQTVGWRSDTDSKQLRLVEHKKMLVAGTYCSRNEERRDDELDDETIVCLDLPKGASLLHFDN